MQFTDDTETRGSVTAPDAVTAPAPAKRAGQTLRAVPSAPGTHPAPATRTEPDSGPAPEAPAPSGKKRGRRRAILGAIVLAALVGGSYEGYHWWTVGRFEASTDDAYLQADMTILSAKVGGYVTEVAVAENQEVHQGDVIARIDDGDYTLAVQAADNKVTVQKAAIDRIDMETQAARAQIDAAAANVASAEATLTLTSAELDRKTRLAKTDFASRQAVDTARADHDKAIAALAAAKAAETEAHANVAVLAAQKGEAQATLASLVTERSQAERDLSFTIVRAPVDGVVGNKAVDVGELVQPGTRLAAVVPLGEVYVEANFKETQLRDMHPGQPAAVEVDAFPGRVFQGEVASISPASGALFSLLPPENATGNFTKVVQRLPVRVALSSEAIATHALRPGMSVVVTVDIKDEDAAAASVPPSPVSAAAAAETPAAPSGRRASRTH